MAESKARPTVPFPRSAPLEPSEQYALLREQSPVTRCQLANGEQVWMVCGYQEARAVLSSSSFSSDWTRAGFPMRSRLMATSVTLRTLVRMDPPEHTRYRRVLSKEFTAQRMSDLRPDIARVVDLLVDRMLQDAPPVDLMSRIAFPLPSQVICTLLGVSPEDRSFFEVKTAVMLRRSASEDEARGASNELLSYLDGVVREKERHPGRDLLSRMLSADEGGDRWTREDVIGMARLLLSAGHETTASMIGLGLLTLLQHPGELSALRERPALLGAAVEELLRYLSIVQFGLLRVSTRETRIGGQVIRAGEGVIVSLEAANRDPSVFPRAEAIEFGRARNNHLAFGHGVHRCLGEHLARVELEAVLGSLIARCPTLRLAVPLEQVPFAHDMFDYGVHELPVTW